MSMLSSPAGDVAGTCTRRAAICESTGRFVKLGRNTGARHGKRDGFTTISNRGFASSITVSAIPFTASRVIDRQSDEQHQCRQSVNTALFVLDLLESTSAQHAHNPRQDSTSPSIERDSLLSVLEALHRCSAADLQTKLHLGGQLYRMLVEGSSTSAHARTHSYRHDFREAGGFLVVIQLISTIGAPSHSPTLAGDHSALQVEIFKLALSVLSASLLQHPLNIKAFEATVGWESLSNAVEIAYHQGISPDHVFGSLLGLAWLTSLPMPDASSRLDATSKIMSPSSQRDHHRLASRCLRPYLRKAAAR